jgi:hypothetical protein
VRGCLTAHQPDRLEQTGRAVAGPERGIDRERVRRRRRFAVHLAPIPLLLVGAGIVLAAEGGVLHVLGLTALAYGVGLAVALIWLAAGRNPVTRR